MKIQSSAIIAILSLLGSTTLLAQPVDQITNSNYSLASATISEYLGDNCAVATSQLSIYFQGILTGTSSNCGIPDPTVDSQDANNIYFKWAPVAGASVYRIYYINLQTGVSGYQTFTGNQSLYKLANIPDGRYIFSVQAGCSGTFRSFFGIIIAEKDLMSAYNPNLPCECISYSGISVILQNGAILPSNSEMDLIIPTGMIQGEIKIHVETGEQSEVLQYNPDCGNIEFIAGMGWPTIGISGHVSFLDGEVNYDFFIDNDGDEEEDFEPMMTMSLCYTAHGGTPPNSGNPTEITVQPNPFQDRFNIRFQSDGSPVQISLQNLLGQHIGQWESPTFEGFFEMDISAPYQMLPGIYLLQLRQGEQTTTKRVIKI
ncbi:MAG: T9SS type A sorting domain-containing protein [Bacteroidetes bacterium]|nr:T9SS type A sorting domain-containing protein [Bacteroidota bacterium]